jgi:Low-density lipoprotein receptor domain class A
VLVDGLLLGLSGGINCSHLTQRCSFLLDSRRASDITCSTGFSIPGELQCNGINECGDESDERRCGNLTRDLCANFVVAVQLSVGVINELILVTHKLAANHIYKCIGTLIFVNTDSRAKKTAKQ